MNNGVIIGYFYGKGLILCPNNKLRYFDIEVSKDGDFMRNYPWQRCYNKKVDIWDRIYRNCIASYSIDKKDKYKVLLEKIYSSNDTFQGPFSKELTYVVNHLNNDIVAYDAGQIMKEISDYVLSLDIDSILSTYTIEQFKEVNPNIGRNGSTTFGVRYFVNSEDSYIKSILPLKTKISTVYLCGNVEDSYNKRLYDEELKNISIFKSRYSVNEHIRFLSSIRINNEVKSIIENERKRTDMLNVISANFPVKTIGYIINKRWPHMSPRMLCVKYNNEFDGTNFDIFGHKDSSKKRYFEKLARIEYNAWLKKRKDRFDTCDSEQEVMKALWNGCGEYFGY